MAIHNDKEARSEIWGMHRRELKRKLDEIQFTTTQRSTIENKLTCLEKIFTDANNLSE